MRDVLFELLFESESALVAAAKAQPWAALKYASDKLPESALVAAAKAQPWAALELGEGVKARLVSLLQASEKQLVPTQTPIEWTDAAKRDRQSDWRREVFD